MCPDLRCARNSYVATLSLLKISLFCTIWAQFRVTQTQGSVATYGCEVDVDRMTQVRSDAGLYEEYRTNLVRYASWLVGPDDAADVVSDAMESLLRSGLLADAESPQALMHRAVLAKAKSMQRSFYRRRARERQFAERWVQQDPGFRSDVVEAVVRLSPQQRACVYLTYWEDLTPPRVAEHLGIGEGTVKQHLARARAKLREVLND